jgi:hypothetical protein
MKWNERLWKQSIRQYQQFMSPLVSVLGRSERRLAATRYVEGLLTPGERKSIEPLAARLGVDKQSLQQFVTDSPWNDKTVWSSLRREVIPHLEPIEAWIVDETGWLKQGSHSVGVSHQYCGAVGKQANCQVSVEVAVSDGWVAAPIAGQLYLPRSWSDDPARCAAAGVPDATEFQTKPQLAGQLIGEALSDGIAPAPVLGMRFTETMLSFGLNCDAWAWSSFCRSMPASTRAGTIESKPRSNACDAMCKRGSPWPGPWRNLSAGGAKPFGNRAPGWLPVGKLARLAWGGARFSCNKVCNDPKANSRGSGWWWTGRPAIQPPITTTWLTFTARPPRPAV